MKRRGYYWLCAMGLMGLPTAIAGCRDDGECAPGSRCFVARGYEGRCASHLPMIDVPRDAAQLSTPLHQRSSTGTPCQFNVDCLPGFACYKLTQATVQGQCFRP